MNQLQLILGGLGLAAFLGLAGYSWLLRSQLDDLAVQIRVVESERDTAQAQTKRLYQSIDIMSVERTAADNRAQTVQNGRETVLSVPEAEDGPVANTLLRALQAADQMGGHK